MTGKVKPAKLRPDVAETAFRVMQEAIGERPKMRPPGERTEKNADAVESGRQGGKTGGRARATAHRATQAVPRATTVRAP